MWIAAQTVRPMARSIAVDVGGTFTDLIYRDDASGEVILGKVSTVPAAPDEGVLAVLDATLSSEQLSEADSFRHGTTVGLNALLEGRGATVGLLATRGFRDVLELRRGDRDDPYDLFWAPPRPMVARELRRPVTERVLAGGEIDTALDEADVAAAARTFAEAGVTAVAIAFMNAYVNPVHERRAAECLRAAGFDGHLSLSHRVSGEYREYERTTTTVIDAFVRGRMNSYLGRLEAGLRERGFRGQCLIMRSGGGAMTFEEAADRSVETILSGPVAGARAVAELAGDLALEHAVAADVGGTSFDTCLIDHGRPPVLYEGTVRGLPIQTPWIDVRSIGAGGGSIAHVDAGGLLRVGPHSAGADPGPAAYGRGGRTPTVTDAAVVLGMLPAEEISGGVTLDRGLAEEAFAELTERLGFSSPAEVARGVVQIVVAQMGDAIRGVTVDRGQDPREASLVAFGGAGPLFGGLLAAELGAQAVIVPSYAGNFSAWGLLRAEIARTASRTYMAGLSADGLDGGSRGRRGTVRTAGVRRCPRRAPALRPARHPLRRPGAHAHRGRSDAGRRDRLRARAARRDVPARVRPHVRLDDRRADRDRLRPRDRRRGLRRRARCRGKRPQTDATAGGWGRAGEDPVGMVVQREPGAPVRARPAGGARAGQPAPGPRDRARADRHHVSSTTAMRSRCTRRAHSSSAARAPRRGRDMTQAAIEISRGGAGRRSGTVDADPITTEIIRHGCNAAADQMKRALVRTSFSPVIYEVLDFAAALYDRDVCLLAQAPSLPVFMGTMSFCVRRRSRRSAARTRSSPATSSSTTTPTGPGRTRRTRRW